VHLGKDSRIRQEIFQPARKAQGKAAPAAAETDGN